MNEIVVVIPTQCYKNILDLDLEGGEGANILQVLHLFPICYRCSTDELIVALKLKLQYCPVAFQFI